MSLVSYSIIRKSQNEIFLEWQVTGMRCTSLRLIHIRNVEDQTLDLDAGLTILVGSNGCGKTNRIESLYYGSVGKSFRTSNDNELIQMGKDQGTILLTYEVHQVSHTIKIKLSKEQGKKIFLNDTPIKKKELIGLFRTVLFTPDELQLIKGPPLNRRRFLDMEISQVSPRYYETLLRYNRAVQQRNAEFRQAQWQGRKPEVDMWDMQIASGASYIVKKRLEALQRMNDMVPSMESALTGHRESLLIKYQQSGSDEAQTDMEWYLQKLSFLRDEDSRLCRTSIGPHRDELVFLMNGMDIGAYGSQGQQRTAILAMKLSEMEFIKEETGTYPVLLLDDMGSELDSHRRKALMDYLKKQQIQAVMTGTDAIDDEDVQVLSMEPSST